MNTLKVTIKDRLAIITLNRPKSNALNRELIIELDELLTNIANDNQIGGVMITGQGNFFSAGLDLIDLYNYDKESLASFWDLFLQFTVHITAFKKPLVAAINGHSPAGGCVIALACDYRVMAEGNFIIGLNEVPVGIIVPNSIFNLYAFWLGTAQANRSLLTGKLFTPQEALAVGLVDELTKQESILTIAERQARKLMAFESNTWQQSKINIRQQLLESMNANQQDTLDALLTQWWMPSTRENLKTIIENLKPKN